MKYQSLDIKLIAFISLIGLVYFVVVIITMHKLRPDYNPRSRYISEYAVGKYGQLAASSFVIYGLAILGIYWSLPNVLPVEAKSNIGLTLMAVWGLAMTITGLFKVDLKDKAMSLHGTVHAIASNLGVVASVIGSICISVNFAHSESTQSLAFNTLIIAIVALIWAVFLWLGLLGDLALKYHHNVSNIILSLHNLTGLTERLLLGISVLWLIIIVNWIIKS